MMALGNIFLMFEYWANGQLPNAGATLFAAAISSLTMLGMFLSGLFPLRRGSLLIPGSRPSRSPRPSGR